MAAVLLLEFCVSAAKINSVVLFWEVSECVFVQILDHCGCLSALPFASADSLVSLCDKSRRG